MSANDTQVAGTHYRSALQHWDLAHELDLGYFEGQITKYLTRHRSKKGKEDLEKAVHFTKKLKELAVLEGKQPRHKYGTIARFSEYASVNKLLPLELLCIMSVCSWSMVQDLDMLLDRMSKLMNDCYPPIPEPEVTDGSAPDGSYVNQGRDI